MSNANYKTLDAGLIAAGLQKPKRVGVGKYVACCPAHDDKTPSLSITDSSSGKLLVHCHAGCSQEAVITALREKGLWSSPSYEAKIVQRAKVSKDTIWRHQMILATELARADQGLEHTEEEKAQIEYSIRYLEEHGYG